MDRPPGWSVRLKLSLSYAGFLMAAGLGLIAVVWVFLLRYVPPEAIRIVRDRASEDPTRPPAPGFVVPGRADLWEAFAPKAALMLGILLVFGLVGGWLLAGRMLAPLSRISAVTRMTGTGSLSQRVDLHGRQDEFRELADSVDSMLARLEAHVAEQQRFAANASHELRTPLSIMRTLLDVAQRDPDRDVDELVGRLQLVTTRAIDLTDGLLVLSRAEQGSFDPEPVDLSLVLEEAVETLLPLTEKHSVVLRSSGSTAATVGSPALLLQLTTNLLHNAIVHNLPEQGLVRVTIATTATGVTLTVENTGDQLAPELVAGLTEPFRRGTERVHSDQAGVGLGLALVASITRAHAGTLTLAPRPGGGLQVVVQLPSAHGYPTGKSK
ncbi:HAMP domain-containing sensor histidine kinase [Pseudonocardia xishanensis]|uniref:histidine kinase n=1 Tax=Pseudonocardia xishanensis TaxID=630995 RepID=A0ABP8RJN4_9PSEU